MKKSFLSLLFMFSAVSAQVAGTPEEPTVNQPVVEQQTTETTQPEATTSATEQVDEVKTSPVIEPKKDETQPVLRTSAAKPAPVVEPNAEANKDIPKENIATEPKKEVKAEPTKEDNSEKKDDVKDESATSEGKDIPASSDSKDSDEESSKSSGPHLGASYSAVTVDGKMYQRFSLMPEFAIWKIGIALDLEVFIDDEGNFSTLGWDFSSGAKTAETIARKIYYIRYGEKGDTFYTKLGSIDDFTMGYGIAMQGYSNTQLYPGIKKTGIELELNDVSPAGISLQAFLNNFADINGDKYVFAARLGVAPLKKLEMPLLSKLKVSGFVAQDRNSYGGLIDSDGDGVPNDIDAKPFDSDWAINPTLRYHKDAINYGIKQKLISAGYSPSEVAPFYLNDEDILIAEKLEDSLYTENFGYGNEVSSFTIVGGDISLPIISTSLLKLDAYSQIAFNADDKIKGYGFGAPGLWLSLSKITAILEYRHVDGRFQNGYFDNLYELNRASMNISDSTVTLKKNTLDSVLQNGVYGSVGFSIMGFVHSQLVYQKMVGVKYVKNSNGTVTEEDFSPQNIYAELGLDQELLDKIPKLEELKVYWGKDNYDNNKEGLFDPTQDTRYGYDLGIAISEGVIFNYNTVYYHEQTGPKRTDVKEKKQQIIGISAKF